MVDDRLVVAAQRDGGLLVRVDPAWSADLVTRPGAAPAEMGAGRVMGPGWLCIAPQTIAADEHLSFWIDAALEYNRHAAGTTR